MYTHMHKHTHTHTRTNAEDQYCCVTDENASLRSLSSIWSLSICIYHMNIHKHARWKAVFLRIPGRCLKTLRGYLI